MWCVVDAYAVQGSQTALDSLLLPSAYRLVQSLGRDPRILEPERKHCLCFERFRSLTQHCGTLLPFLLQCNPGALPRAFSFVSSLYMTNTGPIKQSSVPMRCWLRFSVAGGSVHAVNFTFLTKCTHIFVLFCVVIYRFNALILDSC